MKFIPDERHYALGLFIMDGTETLEAIKESIRAERERKFPNRSGNDRFDATKYVPIQRERKPFKAPRPGNDEPKHIQSVVNAIELCEKHGAKFWALGAHTGFVWGVKDGKYVQVRGSGVHEI